MSFVFQTRDCTIGDPRAAWHQMISRHHIPVTAGAPGDRIEAGEAFEGWLQVQDWGGLQVLHTRCSPITYHHGTQELRSGGSHDFFCVLVAEGSGEFEYNGNSVRFEAGDLLFYDTEQMYTLRFPQDVRTVTLRIPRPLILARLQQADRQFAIRIDGSRPMGKLTAGLIESLASLADYPEEQRCREAEAPIIDVLCLAVKDSGAQELRPSPGQEMMLQRIKRDLLGQLEDSSLTVERIARANNISARTLNRLFAGEGATVMKWIWSQRLSASYRAMSDGSVRQVTEAAFRFGFKDASHFTRAFKREYNIPPSRLLGR